VSYKLGLILSLPFLMQIMLFMGDLSIVNSIQTQLDSLAQTISFKISSTGKITDELKDYAFTVAEAYLECVDGCSGYLGDILTFRLYKEYKPIIISSSKMFISVTRSTVIGYFS